MSYEINDRTLIEEMCGEIRTTAQEKYNELQENLKKCGNALPENFAFPLDEDVVGPNGTLKSYYRAKRKLFRILKLKS